MTDPDEQQNLPAVPQQQEVVHSLEIPVAQFEGEFVRHMIGKIPGITLEMDYGYARGTHLKLELEVRVRSVNVDEVTTGKHKGDLKREHTFAIEEAKIIGAYTAEQVDEGVGGGLAATGHDVEDEEQHPDLSEYSEEYVAQDHDTDSDARPEGETNERRDIDPGF